MHRISRIFEFSIYSLVVASSFMLAWAEGFKKGIPPQCFTIPFAFLTYFYVERWRKFSISTLVANVLGLVAFGFAVNELMGDDIEARLLAGAHLLAYLMWVMLLQEKSERHYWSLCALCVLQVAVGAVLTKDGTYGVMLVGFLFASLWTLSVFSLQQCQKLFTAAEQAERDGHSDNAVEAETAKIAIEGTQLLAAFRSPSTAGGSLQRDPQSRWINRRFVLSCLGTSTLTLVAALLLFFLVPRDRRIWGNGQPRINTDDDGNRFVSMTGFSREVQLGDIGQILESTEPVMAVRLFDNDTNDQLEMARYVEELGIDEPLFRGAVMLEYSRGAWKSWSSRLGGWSAQDALNRTEELLRAHPRRRLPSGLIRQEIEMEPVDEELLFAMSPVFAGQFAQEGPQGRSPLSVPLERDRRTQVIKRPKDVKDMPLRFTFYSWRNPELRKRRLAFGRRRNQHFYQAPYLDLSEGLDRLRKLAREVTEFDGDRPRHSPDQMARMLETYLRDSGEYTYTLNATVFDPEIDPVEDFLFNRKTGHCEYYATALALMLRAVGIPSRLVSGFKGGEENRFTGAFEVQERHAHAWVEAMVGDRWEGGDGGWWVDGNARWITLDATPPLERQQTVEEAGSSVGAWTEFKSALSDGWSKYIVNLNDGARRLLFTPIRELFNSLLAKFKTGQARFSDWWRAAKAFFSSPEKWISWQGGAVSFALLAFGACLVWITKRVIRLVRRWAFPTNPQGRQTVAFYERFQHLCRKTGIRRTPSQTPREFAVAVSRLLAKRLPDLDGQTFPTRLVEAYYGVRFGDLTLASSDLDSIEQGLSNWEQALESRRRKPSQSRSP